ncbi:MAG TPA: glycosyltransferase family 1 protein [Methylomirabilota bacterium]|nr:glycosyltransferase family 1 protein [Methylomirabilota bacterium]
MRIGIDASLAGRRGTGTGRYAALLVERLVALDRDDDYVLYFRKTDGADNPLCALEGPRVAKRTTDAPLTLLRLHVNLPIRLASDGVDLYHSLGFFLPWLWRGRTVVTIHDIHPVIQREHWGWAGPRGAHLALRAHIPLAVRQARRILTPSEYVKQTVCERYRVAPEKVVVTPHGADPFFLAAPAPGELEASERRVSAGRFLLYVGALAPHKNVAGLLRAFARLRTRPEAEGVRLVAVAGPGRVPDIAPLIRELGLGGAVTLIGYVDDEVLRALYHRAQALVLPSFGEGFGLPVLEAMACGTPVVTSRISALPEVAADAALYVDPREPDDIASAMGRLLADEVLRRDLAAKGRARAATFSWDRTVAQVLRAYREA